MAIPPDHKGLCGEKKMPQQSQSRRSPKGHDLPAQTVSPPQWGALKHHQIGPLPPSINYTCEQIPV